MVFGGIEKKRRVLLKCGWPNHNNSAKGARHMEENTLIGFVKPGTISDPLTELLRKGIPEIDRSSHSGGIV